MLLDGGIFVRSTQIVDWIRVQGRKNMKMGCRRITLKGLLRGSSNCRRMCLFKVIEKWLVFGRKIEL